MKRKLILIPLSFVFVLFLGSCNDSTSKNSATTKKEKETIVHNQEQETKKDCNDVHWSHHKGPNGPENWKNLCEGFAECGGKKQSPIDINTQNVEKATGLKAPEFHFGKTKTDIINNGHTVQFNVDKGNMVKLNGKDYELLQFHYHALSEHTINGKHAPLEVHFVLKHSDNDLAVIGVLFKEGQENELFKRFLDKFPTEKGTYKSDDTIDLMSLLPKDKSYYYYNGSLTTPPCTQIVSWYVLKEPMEASKEQIEKFSKILDQNYRPVMPLNGRKVVLFQP